MKLFIQLLLLSLCVACVGCDSSEPADEIKTPVFVDTETAAVFVLPALPVPATNPQTGKPTLMPGLYCPECRKWYPVPPPDQINRRPDAALCPKTRTPLVADGPRPEAGKTGASN